MHANKQYNVTGMLTGGVLAALLAGCELTSDSNSDSDSGEQGPTVEPAQGPIEGVDENEQLAFRGIPYAQAPVGERRFAAPEPVDGWDDTLVADEFAPGCLQPAGVFAAEETSEDCLYLNVYTPDTAGSDRPVMVWIHGGAFETGAADASYEPPRLVQEDMVVVTINYRLGLLGFMAHPDLSAAGNGNSGNYGLMDQIAALEWVQQNIDAFGGDPDNVTIFGESAGGHSVLSLLASPQTNATLDRVIVQSGSYNGDQLPLSEAEAAGEGLAAALGCPDGGVDCLRELDAEEYINLQAAQDLDYGPVTGTSALPESINTVLANASYPDDVEVLAGTNLEEGTLFTAIEFINGAEPTSEDEYEDAVLDLMGGDQALADAVVARYPLGNYASPDHALSAIATSTNFVCPALGHARTFAGNGTPVYAYEFADREAPPLFTVEGFDMGASHAFEIQYLFNTEQSLREDRGMDDDQVALANAMVRYWTSFARDGDPNPETGDLAHWPGFMQGDMLRLTTPAPTGIDVADEFSAYHNCDFWSQQG